MLKVIGWLGSAFGLLGSLLLAINTSFSGWGFVAFLVSNAAWIIYGTRTKIWSMVFMQIGFTATSIIGIYRWMM